VSCRDRKVKRKERPILAKLATSHMVTEPGVPPVPLIWLESNFNTRSRTEQFLRPELENGIITQHDFDAAVDFFPSTQRYYSVR